MSSLAELPDLVGFFSYSRSDDEHSEKALSRLRKRIRSELRLQLGRDLRLWQDVEAIPYGTLWEGQIKNAIAESAFFIPIVTPSAVNSKYCRMEFEAFLAREAELRRSDLVFPILYIRVPGLAGEDQRSQDNVLKIIHARQYVDWTKIRHDGDSPDVAKQIARFCEDIVEALHRPCESPEERARRERAEADAPLRAEREEARRTAEAEARRREEAEKRQQAERDAQEELSRVSTQAERPMESGKEKRRDWGPVRLGALVVVFIILAIAGVDWFTRDVSEPATHGPSVPDASPMPATQSDFGVNGPLSPERESALKPKDSFKECDDCPEMVVVPAGSFTMGSLEAEEGRLSDEGPKHVVTISKPFAVGKLHVTVDQFTSFVRESRYDAGSKCSTFEGSKWEERADRSWRNPGFVQEGSHPVVCLDWNDANAYVEWLTKKTQKPYRLLTEAEWEYAARGRTLAGTYPRFWFGDDDKNLCRYGNGTDQMARDSIAGAKNWTIAPCNDRYAYTSPAGHYEPNAFGLYDMSGNAWQWTEDCRHDSYGGAPADSTAWTAGGDCNRRVVRGGSWINNPSYLRSAQRSWCPTECRYGNIGFRLARTLTP